MAFSNGVFARLYTWVTDAANGIKIRADRMDAEFDGIATALSTCLLKDGTQTVTANIPMASFKFTGLGNGSARTDSAALGQVQDSAVMWGGTSGGSANAQTVTLSPAVTGQAAGRRISFIAGYTNTAAATLSPNGVSAAAFRKKLASGLVALTGGEIVAGHVVTVLDTGTYYVLESVSELVAGADIASATTCDIGASTGEVVVVTGTTTITGFGSTAAPCLRIVIFAASLTLTHNGTSLILPGAANITTAAGDVAIMWRNASGNWRCFSYQPSAGVSGITGPGSSTDYGIPTWNGTGGTTVRSGIAPGTSGYPLVSGGTGADHAYEPFARRNHLLNGGLDIWQHGTSFSIAASTSTTTSVYTADRWAMHTGANQACTISRQTGLTDGSQYCARVARNNGETGTGVLRFEQAFDLPQLTPIVNQTVTISFTARKGANYSATSDALAVKIYTGTGAAARRSAGSYTSEATPLSTSVTLTGSSTRYTATSTAIATGTTQLSVAFEFTPVGTAGAADYYEIDDIQIEIGSKSTPMERRPEATDLAACQRFMVRLSKANGSPIILAYGVVDGATNAASIAWNLPVPMRTDPSVSHGTIGNLVVRQGGGVSETVSSVTTGPYMVGSIATVKYTTAGSTLTNLSPVVLTDGNANGTHDFWAEV